MVEGPLSSLLQRREKPTFYLPDAIPQPVWASASSQLSVKKGIEEVNATAKGREGQPPGPEGNSSATYSSRPSDSRPASHASSGVSGSHQLQTSHKTSVSEMASAERSTEALPAPISIPINQPDFEDVVSNGESSEFQDARSEGDASPALTRMHIHESEALRSHDIMSSHLQLAAQVPARKTARHWRTA